MPPPYPHGQGTSDALRLQCTLQSLGRILCHSCLPNEPHCFLHPSPCVLIGYAPNSKAYHLWDRTTDCIFNTFHVNFIKQFQSSDTTTSSLPPVITSHPLLPPLPHPPPSLPLHPQHPPSHTIPYHLSNCI